MADLKKHLEALSIEFQEKFGKPLNKNELIVISEELLKAKRHDFLARRVDHLEFQDLASFIELIQSEKEQPIQSADKGKPTDGEATEVGQRKTSGATKSGSKKS